MNQHYDKIALLVAIVFLIAGAVGGVMGMSSSDVKTSILESSFRGDDIEKYSPQSEAPPIETWDAPPPQVVEFPPDEWPYEVFTPPNIFYDSNLKLFTRKAYGKPAPSNLELVKIERPLYRIKLDGYFEAADGIEKNATISFFNRETGELKRMKVGDYDSEWGIAITDFSIRKSAVDGMISSTAYAKIFDMQGDTEIDIVENQPTYLPGKIDIVFQPLDDGDSPMGSTIVFHDAGATFEVLESQFELRAFDYEAQKVDIIQKHPNLLKQKPRELYAKQQD